MGTKEGNREGTKEKTKGGTKGGTNEKGDQDKTGDLGRKEEKKKEGPKPEKKVPWGICGFSVNCPFSFIWGSGLFGFYIFSREVYPYFTFKGSISILLFL